VTCSVLPGAVADAVQEEMLFRAYEMFEKSPSAQKMSLQQRAREKACIAELQQERAREKARIAELQSLYAECQVVCARLQAEPKP
jgi:hypothetical protein